MELALHGEQGSWWFRPNLFSTTSTVVLGSTSRRASMRFQRRRVLIHYTEGESVRYLAAGPPADSEVVVDGAAELYGTEFGAGK